MLPHEVIHLFRIWGAAIKSRILIYLFLRSVLPCLDGKCFLILNIWSDLIHYISTMSGFLPQEIQLIQVINSRNIIEHLLCIRLFFLGTRNRVLNTTDKHIYPHGPCILEGRERK